MNSAQNSHRVAANYSDIVHFFLQLKTLKMEKIEKKICLSQYSTNTVYYTFVLFFNTF